MFRKNNIGTKCTRKIRKNRRVMQGKPILVVGLADKWKINRLEAPSLDFLGRKLNSSRGCPAPCFKIMVATTHHSNRSSTYSSELIANLTSTDYTQQLGLDSGALIMAVQHDATLYKRFSANCWRIRRNDSLNDKMRTPFWRRGVLVLAWQWFRTST